VAALFADENRLAAMSKASATLARPEAARQIADEVLAAATRASGAPYATHSHIKRTGT
jgi:UDP-N-acetylglucosamine:LPS N-acetylglucosamine transferase